MTLAKKSFFWHMPLLYWEAQLTKLCWHTYIGTGSIIQTRPQLLLEVAHGCWVGVAANWLKCFTSSSNRSLFFSGLMPMAAPSSQAVNEYLVIQPGTSNAAGHDAGHITCVPQIKICSDLTTLTQRAHSIVLMKY